MASNMGSAVGLQPNIDRIYSIEVVNEFPHDPDAFTQVVVELVLICYPSMTLHSTRLKVSMSIHALRFFAPLMVVQLQQVKALEIVEMDSIRFVGFHASQCGFCTPGMCMSFFSALVNAEKTNRSEAPTGFSKLTVSEAEKAITGNHCPLNFDA